jgi:hypothetical protein
MNLPTRNQIIKYFIYTVWLDFLNTIFLTGWLFIGIHYSLEQYINWLWQGFLLNLLIAYPMTKAILWMDGKSDMALGINTKNREWMRREVLRMNRGIRTIDEKILRIEKRRTSYRDVPYLKRLVKMERTLCNERIKCRAKIQLLEKMLK